MFLHQRAIQIIQYIVCNRAGIIIHIGMAAGYDQAVQAGLGDVEILEVAPELEFLF